MNNYVIVLCGQNPETPEQYCNAAYGLGKLLAKAGKTTVFGGWASGATGSLGQGVNDSRAEFEVQGELISSLPLSYKTSHESKLHPKLSGKHWTGDSYQDKQKLYADADAVIALPGGIGTLQELLSVILMKREEFFHKPIIIINQDGFYDSMQDMLKRIEADKLVSHSTGMWLFVSTGEEALALIEGEQAEAPTLAAAI